jgi:hypothetical protein
LLRLLHNLHSAFIETCSSYRLYKLAANISPTAPSSSASNASGVWLTLSPWVSARLKLAVTPWHPFKRLQLSRREYPPDSATTRATVA